jgi:hypothetical protein
MVKANLKVVVEGTHRPEDSRIPAECMEEEGDQPLNSTMMTPELDPSRLLSVHIDYMPSLKWVKAHKPDGHLMIPVRAVLEYLIHRADHHLTPTQTLALDDPPRHLMSLLVLALLHPDQLLRPTRTVQE